MDRRDNRMKLANVRFWHKADIQFAPTNVRFRGKSGHRLDVSKCLLMTRRRRVQNDSGQHPGTCRLPVRTGGGSYVHIRRAISHTLSSLRLSSSMERPFPTIEEAKPHCGLSANRSSGTKRFACMM